MPVSDIPIFSMLRNRMQWHQERQRLLAENVANSDTPGFRPRDLDPPDQRGVVPQGGALVLARTDPGHLGSSAVGDEAEFGSNLRGGYRVRPSGNAVNLEDEMLKVAANQMDYQTVSTLYSQGLGLIKTALGKG